MTWKIQSKILRLIIQKNITMIDIIRRKVNLAKSVGLYKKLIIQNKSLLYNIFNACKWQWRLIFILIVFIVA